jgi:hypothetical protein
VQWGALMGNHKIVEKKNNLNVFVALCYDSESYSCETIRKTTLALEN